VGLLPPPYVGGVADAVQRAGLPARIDGLSADAAVASMRGDKKAAAGAIGFILLERIGRAVQREVPDDALRATLTAGGYA